MKQATPQATLLCASVLAWATAARAEPALTVYNQNFAVVRDTLTLDLKPGLNRVQVADTTALLEPDSVVLRDPAGRRQLQVVEQFYRADPVSQSLLLSLYEGKTIDFRVQRGDKTEIVQGKIIRSGYVPVPLGARVVGVGYYDGAGNYILAGATQPVIQVDGQLRFSLPGEPIFPALPEDVILKPTLNWLLRVAEGGPLAAEMAYVTGGMNWKADYNVVAPESKDPNQNPNSAVLDLTGWVTLTNASGKTFENARIKLMAGDVSKVQPENAYAGYAMMSSGRAAAASLPGVTQKTFDEYHLYTLTDNTTLRDRETKQVEFVRAQSVKSARVYIYDGVQFDQNRYAGYGYENIRNEPSYGTQSNAKVWVMREFANTRENGLGIPLPKGRLRFYQRDTGGQLEFIGENVIDHTPQGETVRVYTGNAFDLVGQRKRTTYKTDSERRFLDEAFEITLRNRKTEAVEVRVVEHLYRGDNWAISQKSNVFLKQDSNTVEFRVQVPPEGEKTVTYTVHYTW